MASISSVETTNKQMDSAHPNLQSIRDLECIIEASNSTDATLLYTTFFVITADDTAWFGQLYKPKAEITLEEYTATLKRVPDHDIFPPISSEEAWTIAPQDVGSNLFIKRPMLSNYDLFRDDNTLAQILLDEATILERLAEHPHPNIIRYYGIRMRSGLMTGLVFEKHQHTLTEHVKQNLSLDVDGFVLALKSAINHLHSLGLAHNDLNPDNIMVDADCMPILIDFGSCRPFGKRLSSGSTVGWVEEPSLWSNVKHDIGAFEKIKEWFKNPWYD